MTYCPGCPLLGTPRATAAQVVRYMLARPHSEYTDFDIAQVIVPAYFATCAPVGVDPVLLLAQVVHETGNVTSWWAGRPRRNPAGIGVTGRRSATRPVIGSWAERDGIWYEGVSFADWVKDSIPAHVGRILAYALPTGTATPEQVRLIQQALDYRPLSIRLRGTAPTLKALGKAHNRSGYGWASPGTEYGAQIAEIASLMGEYPA